MTASTIAPDAPAYAARLDLLSGEGALDVLLRARELEHAGRDVVHLEIGEPDFATPEHIVEAGIAALRRGETHYGPPAGIAELREAIAANAATRGIRIAPDQVVVTPGAKPAVFYAILSLVNPGDEVLVPDPGFPIYPVSRMRLTESLPFSTAGTMIAAPRGPARWNGTSPAALSGGMVTPAGAPTPVQASVTSARRAADMRMQRVRGKERTEHSRHVSVRDDVQSRDALEVAHVSRHQRRVLNPRRRCNQQIHGRNRLTATLELGE